MNKFLPNFKYGTSAKIDSNPVIIGSLYVSTDTHQIFIDIPNNQRIRVTDTIQVASQSDLPLIPLDKYYVVQDTSEMFYFNSNQSEWVKLSNDVLICEGEKFSLLTSTDKNKLVICTRSGGAYLSGHMYKWDGSVFRDITPAGAGGSSVDVEQLESRLSNIETSLIDANDSIININNTLSSHGNAISSNQSSIANNTTEIAVNSSRINAISTTVSDHDTRIEQLETELINHLGFNVVQSISSLPVDKRLVVATISSDSSLTLSSGLSAGHELHAIIINSGNSDINVAIPTNIDNKPVYIDGLYEIAAVLLITARTSAEVNIISDNNAYYVRTATK